MIYSEEPKYKPIEKGRPNLMFSMIKENLVEKLPIEPDSVTLADLQWILDNRTGVWTTEIIAAQQVGQGFCVIVRLKIHAADGVYYHDGHGASTLSSQGFDNAYFDALKKACELFGLGRGLLMKKKEIVQNPEPQNTQQSLPIQQEQSKANQHNSKVNNDPATLKQSKLIVDLCVKKELNEEKLAQELCGVKFENITKGMASVLIKYVSEYKANQ